MDNVKKLYCSPITDVEKINTNTIMIEIGSGNTSPEESDANQAFFSEEDEFNPTRTQSLWED